MCSKFEALDHEHCGTVSDSQLSYNSFLNHEYRTIPLKKECLWVTFRYLSDGEKTNLINVTSLRRRLLMMDWPQFCADQSIHRIEEVQGIINQVVTEVSSSQQRDCLKSCPSSIGTQDEMGITFCQFISYMNTHNNHH